jgi:hypothetical protein
MNIAMEQTEEYVNGQLKEKYGDAFIRGNNGAALCVFFFFDSSILFASASLSQFCISAPRRDVKQHNKIKLLMSGLYSVCGRC